MVFHLGDLPEGHSVTEGQWRAANKGVQIIVEHRAFDVHSRNRIRPVEHHEFHAGFRGFFHHVEHRAHIGVEACPDVLNVEYQQIGLGEHFLARAPVSTGIEAPNRHAGGFVPRVKEAIVTFYPTPSGNVNGKNYAEYCRFSLIKYKPWVGKDVATVWGGTEQAQEDIIQAWETFKGSDTFKQL